MTCLTQSYSFISNLLHNTQNQASIIHTKPRKQSHIALSCPAPRSGWRASLRLEGLAQARRSRPSKPHSPRRGLKKGSRSTRGISLRRDPSRLGEMLARSKSRAGRLGDLSHKSPGRAPYSSRLGETGSLGRD